MKVFNAASNTLLQNEAFFRYPINLVAFNCVLEEEMVDGGFVQFQF